jgi:DsbC/DsbD-like thiol-disulfide interchange protein
MKVPLTLALLSLTTGTFAQDVNPVRWSFSDHDVKVAPGASLTVHLTAEIEPGWHLYGMKKIDDGPIPTTLVLDKGQEVEIAGPIHASPPVSLDDPNFGTKVDFYVGRANFELPIRVTNGNSPGSKSLKVTARYQMCNDHVCLAPRKLTFSLPIEILGGR